MAQHPSVMLRIAQNLPPPPLPTPSYTCIYTAVQDFILHLRSCLNSILFRCYICTLRIVARADTPTLNATGGTRRLTRRHRVATVELALYAVRKTMPFATTRTFMFTRE